MLTIEENQLLRSIADIIFRNQKDAKNVAILIKTNNLFDGKLDPIIKVILDDYDNRQEYRNSLENAIANIQDSGIQNIFRNASRANESQND
ncbi:hypothetical protein [Photobacterium damselae]|uniref:hypothetical protein n=1 Tax=Photobacterium damselae TaxID=38293 RepID=UPI0015F6E38F|nr:hypothetical protein [Photobacterium damselae]MBA5683709.1 hypothetical protein [Photobacterium damselae subsp. damselae]